MMNSRVVVFLLVSFIGSTVYAQQAFNLSLIPDVALHDRNEYIRGVSLGVFSENPQEAFALGIINGSTGESAGLSLGIANYADTYFGGQLGLFNVIRNEFGGLQVGAFNMVLGDFSGWQNGILNVTQGGFSGWQYGIVNFTRQDFVGLQSGWLNVAGGSVLGLQIGLVNYAGRADRCIQVGLANIIADNQLLIGLPEELSPAMIMVNWGF